MVGLAWDEDVVLALIRCPITENNRQLERLQWFRILNVDLFL